MLFVWVVLAISLCIGKCAGEGLPGYVPARGTILDALLMRSPSYDGGAHGQRLLFFQSFNPLFVDFGDMQQSRKAFHDFIHPPVSLLVFGGHQLYALSQRLMALSQPFQSFVNCHLISPARWFRANNSMAESAPRFKNQNALVLSPRSGISELGRQHDGGSPLNFSTEEEIL
jgi:hypothetical protein